jgi:hypothetical protein
MVPLKDESVNKISVKAVMMIESNLAGQPRTV